MNLPREWAPSLTLIGVLALETTLVAGLTMLGVRQVRSAQWARSFWQGAVVAMGALVVLECLGVAREVGAWALHSAFPGHGAIQAPTPASVLAGPLRSDFPDRVQAQVTARRLSSGAQAGALAGPLPIGGAAPKQSAPPVGAEGPEPYLVERSWPWVELVWAIGTATVLIPGALAHLFFFLFHRRRRVCFDGCAHQQLAALARRMRIRRRVRIFESARLRSPAAFGILRPSVGLPQGFSEQFSPAQQQVMIAHELAHIRGHDLAWQAVADVVAALLWWQPLAWVARRQLRAAAESAADEASHLVEHGPSVLAECLLRLASAAATSPSAGSLRAAGFRSGLGRRIERLVHSEGREWKPPGQWQAGCTKAAIALGGLTIAILGTAWANPNNEGAPMKSLKETWQRSAATLTLLAAFSAEPGTVNAGATPESRTQLAGRNKEIRLAQQQPTPSPATPAVLGDIPFAGAPQQKVPPGQPSAAPAAKPAPAAVPADQAESEEQDQPTNVYRMDPRLLERYGLKGATRYSPNNATRVTRGKQQVENKLNLTVFNEVQYDGLPLSEVIRDLQEQTRRKDPAKQGINIIITSVPESPVPAGIDPTTGAPIAATAVDLNNIVIRLHLRDVRLKDVLDAVTRVSDQPIKYAVEDYGVVISPTGGQAFQGFGQFSQNRAAEAPHLLVRTFRVDTNNFLAGLDTAFGVTPAKEGDRKDGRAVQQALRQLLQQLGINLDVAGKAVFYNELTGIVMVRATAEDLDLVQAAIETLGGRVHRVQNARDDRPGAADRLSVTVMGGGVTRQGSIALPSDGAIDLVEAIARAGGFTGTANKNKIELVRNGQKTTYTFSALQGTTAEKIWLEPGDSVVVPESLF